jgi:hypothetical protein
MGTRRRPGFGSALDAHFHVAAFEFELGNVLLD